MLTTTSESNGSNSSWREVAESGEGLAFEDFLSFRLGRLNTLLQRETTRRYLDPFGLTHPEWRVLARLNGHVSIEMSQLTLTSLMDKAGISRAVEMLLGKGLAQRHAHPANAKRRIVAITPAGRRAMRKVLPLALREQAALLRLLSAQERTMLDGVLSRLTQALQGSAEVQTDG